MEDEDGYFGERVAATYDGTSGVFGPGTVEATAGVLAVGTVRLAFPHAGTSKALRSGREFSSKIGR